MAPKDDQVETDDATEVSLEKGNLLRLTELKALRASTKGSISRIKSLIVKKGATLSSEELDCRLGILDSYFKQLLSVQSSIDRICPTAEATTNAEYLAELEDMYVSTKSMIMGLKPARRASTADVSLGGLSAAVTVPSRVRRQIDIPKFNGKYCDFPKFLAIFTKLVHNEDTYSNCERFLILKESLGPNPLSAISEFDVTDVNYPKALARLKEIFDKKVLMFEEHVSALLSLPRESKASATHLRHVVDSVNAHLSAMLSLGSHTDITHAFLIHLTMRSIDVESQVKWEESMNYSSLPTWKDCSELLTRRCQNLEAREAKVGGTYERQSGIGVKRNMKTTLALEKNGCEACRKCGHYIANCLTFKNMALNEHYNLLRKNKLCFVCLKSGHAANRCTAAKCERCGKAHHGSLHKACTREEGADKPSTSKSGGVSEQSEVSVQTALHAAVEDISFAAEVFLETAVIWVKDLAGRCHPARVVLDSGSQINLMCEKMAQRLQLKRTPCAVGASGIGDISTRITKKVQATIRSRVNDFEVSVEFLLLPRITSAKPDQFVDVSAWRIPNNIELADPNFNTPARVDLLLGAELFLDLLSIGRIQLNEGLPRMQKTLFGWVVSGAAKECGANNNPRQSLLVDSEGLSETEKLNCLVERFWQTEQIPQKSSFWTDEEQECERVFAASVTRDAIGKFIVKLPFKNNVGELGESFGVAERRFLALERRLDRNPATKEAYTEFINEYLRLGHMRAVSQADMSQLKYFSPHQHVVRPDSTTTKLRVVFDCSCRSSSGLSLNDVLMKGPVIQDDLLSIVLRFRCYRYALTADVTKMYRQAWVTGEDANYQAILWRASRDQELKAYRLLTVTYGTTSAPFLATRCLKQLGEENAGAYPLGAQKIMKDFYMDDLISGASNEAELFKIYEDVSTIMNSAHFNLRKWHSNSPKLLTTVPDADREKPLRLNGATVIKTLGIVWEPGADIFRYVRPAIGTSKSITKRVVLAELSTLFDPLGLVNPVIVKGKIFLQDLWLLRVDWDESLPANLHCYWEQYRNQLQEVEKVELPRYILSVKQHERVEMHGFSDASTRAYGCCIYVRCVDIDNGYNIELWSAKSRVAPVKTKSLPRLELLAAELLSSLVTKSKENFQIPIVATYLWTDSEIVLDWLGAHPSTWSTFVANRSANIQEATKDAIWRHVPSRLNPADIVSRGASADELRESIWFSGPDFLRKNCEEWPANKVRGKSSEAEEERRKGISVLNSEWQKNEFVEWIERHSEYKTVRRKVAVLLCALRPKQRMEDITASMLEEALIRVVYCIQQYYFSEELRILRKDGALPPKSKLSGLRVFIDTSCGVELLRVEGRLRNANLPFDTAHQILLPKESNFVRCYVRFLHESHLHVGTQALMAILRQRFWIINARKLVRSITTKCIQCFRCKPQLQKQIMGDLPAGRVSVSRPFVTTGVDFCGPMMTTYKLKGVRLTKTYIAVFICFASKAVHLEVVSDLTAKAFIAALKRFVARRGLCAHLWCENGTNFVGARRELREFKEHFLKQQTQQKISKYCSEHNIEFHHIPPRSPHFGGLWEAAVKSTKYHLTRILADAHLTFEELGTVTAEIEAVLNSRPLTSMSSDPNDETVLTPAHFLIGGPLLGISEPIVESGLVTNMERWSRISAVKQHFWKRWSMEYLQELQKRSKWTKEQRNIKEGDLVLVSEDNMPSKQWLTGRVTSVINGNDGRVRVVEIKTRNGLIRRAIQKIALIPQVEK